MKSELISILLFLLIIKINVGQEPDYSDYDVDNEEIPNTTTTLSSIITNELNNPTFEDDVDQEERQRKENDVIKTKLDAMSNNFRKIITKIKIKFKRIDMVFLVDSSSSVGKDHFNDEISFVKRLLSDFNVSFNYTRVSIITYSSQPNIFINQISEESMDNDKCTLLNNQIPKITFSPGGTNTHMALLKAKDIFEQSSRKQSKKILVLITDGFSNGDNPIPIAEQLKSQNVTIFTLGISSGNLEQLRSLSSKPIENYNFMLSSFSLFESLARKALHTDYKVGAIQPVANSSFCDSLCYRNDSTASCCDVNSVCACGFHSGHYSCICNKGYYGTGLRLGGCELCPNGTYWNSWNSCFNCPDINHETKVIPAMSINDCICKSGFRETQKHRCEIMHCLPLEPPKYGYFVSSVCSNTVNSACGARCNSGYQLTGSSIRVCQENGTWSGLETQCTLKICPAIQIPYYGTALCRNTDLNITLDYSPRNSTFMKNYSVDSQKFTEEFPIDTECTFSCGLGFHLIGSKNRLCLPVSKWDGLQTYCKQILCPILPKIKNATYDSHECFEQKSPHGTNCTITCDEGFELKGPAMKSCGSINNRNGAWSQKSKIPRCVDITPPKIQCPENYSIELSGNKSYVLLSSFEPLKSIEDNSNGNITFWVKPALKEEGTKMYAGNYTFTYVAIDEVKNKAKCNFTISIADTNPPIFENCIDNQTFYVTSKNDQEIEWEEPFIYDTVDDKNITILRNLNYSALSIGEHLINYTAIDQSGNKNSCIIHVNVKEKKCEELEKPENGQRICAKNDTMTWCDFRCNFGYGLMENNTVIENLVLTCDLDKRIWSQETIPECSVIEQPNSVEEVLTISLHSEHLLCEDFVKNQEKLIKELKEDLCGDQECEIITELPECIDADIPNEIPTDSYYNIVKRDLTSSKPIKKIKTSEKIELYVKISKNLGIWRPSSTRSDNIKKIKEELKKVNTSERFRKRLKNMNLDLTSLKLDEKVSCNPGSVSRKLVCVQCTKGTFHDITQNLCIPCTLASYNNQTGQTSCNDCPEYHSTRKIGSRSFEECREMCKPGTFARMKAPKKSGIAANIKTLMPFCRNCGVGEYQSEYDQSTCNKCPDGLISERGSTSINDCFERDEDSCNDRTCGDHGKCVHSDSFYSCECDDDWYGRNCEIAENPCSSSLNPCFNDGICKVVNGTQTICECSSPYQGNYCETIDDPCNEKECQNNAYCYEIDGEARCECLDGFQGDLCEQQIQIDYCASSPCMDAICVNRKDNYECICENGAIGKRCHLQPCDYSPCPKNSICKNLKTTKITKESYICECFAGLKGGKCDEIDNPCVPNNKCHNNAECSPKLLRDPLNITASVDQAIFKEFSCRCPPYFYGDRCEIFTTPDFVFEFEQSSINNYIKFDGPQMNLTDISFCSWIKTNDQFNYGSLVSYANEKFDNAFTFTDYNGFVLYVNGRNVITDIKINDDIWHFLCVSWTMKEGFYEIYLDGNLYFQGYNLSQSVPIEGKGVFIIGQEQDMIGGGFSETESFVGKISYLDFWNRQLTASEVNEFYRSCDPYQGSLASWTDLKLKSVGNVKIDKSDFCKVCEQNLNIDNADVIYGDQSAFVKCNDGFKIDGNPFLFCLRTSRWDLLKLPRCIIVKCELLKTPANGRMKLTKLSYKGIAKFTCDDGFELEGNETLTCEKDGKWSSEVPQCKSLFECETLNQPKNGYLVYASDSGIIREELESYPLGTFAEIKCNDGFTIGNENIISCIENGKWDIEDVEDCVIDEEEIEIEIPIEFWNLFKQFLFLSCENNKPKLCDFYNTEHYNSDLALFELPETKEFEGMDLKLLNLLTSFEYDSNLNAGNFIETLLRDLIAEKSKVDSFRFVICLYIDLIQLDEQLKISKSDNDENINEKIKRLVKERVKIIYKNYLKIIQ